MRYSKFIIYIIMGIGLFALDNIIRNPMVIRKIIALIFLAVALGFTIDKIYYHFLARKKWNRAKRLFLISPVTVGLVYFYTVIVGGYDSILGRLIIFTLLVTVIMDSINSKMFHERYETVNDRLKELKKEKSPHC